MPKKHSLSIPKYCHHKASGQGYVKLNGEITYLGKYELPESRQKYHQIVSEWELNGRRPLVGAKEVVILQIIECYVDWAKLYYKYDDGSPTPQMYSIKPPMRLLKETYGFTNVAEFGPRQLKALREELIQKGLARKTINSYISIVKHCFKKGVEEGLVTSEVFGALHVVDGLRRGRSEAKETAPILPVSEGDVQAVLPFLSPQIKALVQIQLLTGARPGELVGLCPIDFDMSSEVWVVTPSHHKTKHHGKDRFIHFGPQAQEIVKPFLENRPVHQFLFSPKDAEADRYAQAESHRRPNQKPKLRKTDRTLGEMYTVNSYRRAIERACKKAGISKWSPNQLRHSAATRIRADFGLEEAQVILGHSSADITQVYAERNNKLAMQVIKEVG